MPLINQALPKGVRFEPFYDQADLIEKAVNTVVNALSLAFIFICIVQKMLHPLSAALPITWSWQWMLFVQSSAVENATESTSVLGSQETI